ncbi:MAG: hypothetical protein VCA74_00750 [Deltaproteobacteria bacterium]
MGKSVLIGYSSPMYCPSASLRDVVVVSVLALSLLGLSARPAAAVCGDAVLETGSEQCDDGNTVAGDCCDAVCNFEVAGSACPDVWYCNGAETCDGAGVCQAGAVPNCDDGIVCTIDSCNDIDDVCIHMISHYVCSDGVFCNGQEVCDAVSGCSPGPAVDCSPLGGTCAEGVCDEQAGSCTVLSINEAGICLTADVCMTDALCLSGDCVGSSAAPAKMRFKVRFKEGDNNDVLKAKLDTTSGEVPGLKCYKEFSFVVTALDGTEVFSGKVPAGSFHDIKSNNRHCKFSDSGGLNPTANGIRLVRIDRPVGKTSIRAKVRMQGTEMSAAAGISSVLVSAAFGADEHCLTAKAWTCKKRNKSLKCKL